jgi:hypothetical protein
VGREPVGPEGQEDLFSGERSFPAQDYDFKQVQEINFLSQAINVR